MKTHTMVKHLQSERGVAMLTTLLVLMLMSALLVGFTVVIVSDQRYRFIDRDRGQSFYAASGAVEKLTADLGNLFLVKVAPKATDVAALTTTASKPVITGVSYTAPVVPTPLPSGSLSPYYCVAPNSVVVKGANGYTIEYCGDAAGNPTTSTTKPISTGPFAGLIALQTPYQLDVTAKTSAGGETHLSRTIETVAIPVFQFGIFSDVDLSFSAAANFGFGGRVHTNGNLFLAQAAGATLTLPSQVTAVKEVVRQQLSNGVSIDTVGQTGTISLATSSTTFRSLLRTEGSVTAGPLVPPSALNEPTWHTTSLSTYNSYIRNGRTGAKTLTLPLIKPGVGGIPIDIIRRPVAGEDTTNALLYGERLYTKASLRILLSDTSADITTLPGVTGTPVYLDGNWNTAYVANVGGRPAGYNAISVTNPPVALSPGVLSATVNGNSAGGVITPTAGTVAVFKPTFTLGASAVVITCTAKNTATLKLTGCSNTMPTAAIGTALTQISPAGGSSGATANISVATVTGVSTTLQFATLAELNRFNPLPFWDQTADVLVGCTGYTATTYTGCSSNPTNNTVLSSAAMSNAGTGVLGGWIKIDRQNADSTWTDVTLEILNYGIGAPNQAGGGALCADPTSNAIVRLQRLRDNAGAAGGVCNYNTDATGAKDPTNWWPNVLFDAREGIQRDSNYPGANNMTLGGIMYYVGIDAGNLAKWFKGQAPYSATSGPLSKPDTSVTGYTLYFSDRRNNRNAAAPALETAEYGWEDFVNPGVANGVPNGTLETGEDVNGNLVLDVYGGVPNYTAPGGIPTATSVPPCATCVATYGAAAQPASTGYVLTTAARPTWRIPRRVAQDNRAVIFRRALVLSNGGTLGSHATVANRITGLTVVSENPVYVRGDWNAAATFLVTDLHAATSVIADAVTLLSNSWSDNQSFVSPWDVTTRNRPANSYYRLAIVSGKGPIFPKPGDEPASSTFGTDGGAHSFLRMLEGDTTGGAQPTVNYRGSMATLFYNRQAIGPFKCCGSVVYSVPVRAFSFDTDFLTPALLPPNTPVFRDMNAVGFSQDLRPGK